ncbi:MAG TPA: low affinity iron permease family protein [Candidatus Baltobacteraceae bacterium]|jgi:low affinity Fe/Cu permease|nr:low affinity iron permease family protein [Candidatus Baltobacteraceae bacterium]
MTALRNAFGRLTVAANSAAASPVATGLAFTIVAIWALSGQRMHYSNFWQLLMNTTSSVITFLMVFILNNAQNRDTLAINSKLDALILAVEAADNRLIGLERLPASEAQAIQQEVHALKDIANEANTMADGQ